MSRLASIQWTRGTLPLPSEAKLKALKPRDAIYRVADAQGLCIEVTPHGSKLWRYRYRYAGKPKMASLGPWPLIGLSMARQKRDVARRLLLDGINPIEKKRDDAEAKVQSDEQERKGCRQEYAGKVLLQDW